MFESSIKEDFNAYWSAKSMIIFNLYLWILNFTDVVKDQLYEGMFLNDTTTQMQWMDSKLGTDLEQH